MPEDQWEEIEGPQGQFVSWGRTGQSITGKVVSYSQTGGTDYNGEVCPRLVLETTAGFTNYTDKGTQSHMVSPGELVVMNCGQVNLSAKISAAQLHPGDLLRVAYTDDLKTPQGRTVKQFRVQVARGTHEQSNGRVPASVGSRPDSDAEPPF